MKLGRFSMSMLSVNKHKINIITYYDLQKIMKKCLLIFINCYHKFIFTFLLY